jgi:hypothetical protein
LLRHVVEKRKARDAGGGARIPRASSISAGSDLARILSSGATPCARNPEDRM